MLLKGKKILLGITGSIAAYKAAHLTRLLVKEGAEVQVIMSTSALDFISPLTLATLSKHPVYHEFFDPKTGSWTNHVDLGLWADLFLIAPISANTLGKLANGLCDNLLAATYLSARCPVMVAPAMDLDMYQHPSVRENLERLVSFGNIILDAESGELASGLSGQGRLMEPEHILEKVVAHFHYNTDFEGKKVLITSGPTQEAIDPVRFISNHSSGKMGAAIADAFANSGAEVHLVLGVGAKKPKNPHIKIYPVRSANEMYEAASKLHGKMDICVFAAAVADYAPKNIASEKIKKEGDGMTIELVKNVDIAYTLGKAKQAHQIHVGFALETENEVFHAKQKLEKKNFDMIVLNSMRQEGAGFQLDTNKVSLFFEDGTSIDSEVLPKEQIAKMILEGVKKIPVKI
ncbi:bifunctional phosphopantothenoylcysteine decarboxylase/phosphopantothenate--cysteine ligase CoaBC [Cecembia calidifontis]|jgi:phosphopantothenoylcysteine decarboxylase/phosphopantothenate--cysteine ligase|uniref:Coenzyme A biosynthesis bifunctional protein CoaBC n=1 Tax=Cecembia calidifontis TaxID=1187080 RepID=A0A4V2F765_9BACT|nr:bifunctional phosphopantothenoylcysteine decarboxylase/phosphopantothenate--cysteine ligase CoaBC [Cecembia calidifontis]RZS98739.1 phosphopantothenoylcysteine decarboxylase/phosphopantothenate--cysteine ligase [Cecembia calidifontis]